MISFTLNLYAIEATNCFPQAARDSSRTTICRIDEEPLLVLRIDISTEVGVEVRRSGF